MAVSDRTEYLKTIVSNLPENPGCYQYLDSTGTIIYVGKAKNLKRRVSSYFNREHDNLKTRILVSKIYDIRYIVVNTEQDALLLENNLIKQHTPKYNILLKDGKTYPSICVTKESCPRVFKSRNINKSFGFFYGPYTNVYALDTIMELIYDTYKVRTCHFPITEEGLRQHKYKKCLKYHIGRCKAPCEGLQSLEEYNDNIREIREILKGNVSDISKKLLSQMKSLAEEMRYEEAIPLKSKYDALETFRQKREVVSQVYHNIDVFSIEDDENTAFINYLHVVRGCITQAYTWEYKKKLSETQKELLELGIIDMRDRYSSESKEIIVPFEIDLPLEGVEFTIPQKGDKKTLLELSIKNVKQYKIDRLKQADKLNPEQKTTRILTEIQKIMGLPKLPMRIECFDNSNTNGSDPVAGCVVFEKGKPNKKEYRKYIIKTVVGPDDYGSMKEVVRRKYKRAVDESTPLPDLIITDGGKGQMEVVREVIEDELGLDIPIAGLAKDDRHRTNELLYGFPPQVIGMKSDSPLFHLLTRIQDEVHRYAITFHKEKRSKRQTQSRLDNIKGIGEKTRTQLLRKFKSLKRIMEADDNEIIDLIGPAKARILKEALKIDN